MISQVKHTSSCFEKDNKEKTTPFRGILKRSQMLYQAAQAHPVLHLTLNLQMSHVAHLSSLDASTSPYAQSMSGSMLSHLGLISQHWQSA